METQGFAVKLQRTKEIFSDDFRKLIIHGISFSSRREDAEKTEGMQYAYYQSNCLIAYLKG